MTRAVGPSVPLTAGFYDGPNGSLFVVEYSPPDHIKMCGTLVLIAPFAEEMNRSRRMMAALGRALAMSGIRTLIPDLYGTGDSAGDFSDADWTRWRADIAFMRSHTRTRTKGALLLAGIRCGALLAAQSLAEDPGGVDGLMLVQPVTNGARFLQQFLRLRVAAALARGERENVGALMARLDAGETIPVAGYKLSPAMAQTLGKVSIADFPPPRNVGTIWVEIGSEMPEGPDLRQRLPASWQAGSAEYRFFVDRPFWTLPEPAAAPALVAYLVENAVELLS